jgi:flagellar hook-associated protein 3 FlgL
MGGTLGNIYDNASFALYTHTEAMLRLQEQASTGSRINRASDDPSAAHRILGLSSQKRSLENFMANLVETISVLEIASTVISEMGSQFVEVRALLTQVTGGIYGEDARRRIADGINDTLEQMVSFANTKHANQFVFGGGDTTSSPYVVERTDGRITSVTYRGSYEARNVEMAPGVEASAFQVGDDIFRSNDRGTPEFILENTGAQVGSGTSNATGTVWLTVEEDGSGGYNLSIDDGLTPVNTDGTDTNLAVEDSDGRVLYVNATGITGAGVDLVSVPGTYDVFNTLIDIRNVLENERGLPVDQLQTALAKSESWAQEVSSLLLQNEVSMGSRIGFLDDLRNTLNDIEYDTKDEVVRLQEADIAQIAIDISRREVLYQMSLSIAGKLLSITLLDFIG